MNFFTDSSSHVESIYFLHEKSLNFSTKFNEENFILANITKWWIVVQFFYSEFLTNSECWLQPFTTLFCHQSIIIIFFVCKSSKSLIAQFMNDTTQLMSVQIMRLIPQNKLFRNVSLRFFIFKPQAYFQQQKKKEKTQQSFCRLKNSKLIFAWTS
jgi:hypothetical protein